MGGRGELDCSLCYTFHGSLEIRLPKKPQTSPSVSVFVLFARRFALG